VLYGHFQYKYPFIVNYNTSASKLPQKSFPLEYVRMVGIPRISIWTRPIACLRSDLVPYSFSISYTIMHFVHAGVQINPVEKASQTITLL
jgi:hypothetical protein